MEQPIYTTPFQQCVVRVPRNGGMTHEIAVVQSFVHDVVIVRYDDGFELAIDTVEAEPIGH